MRLYDTHVHLDHAGEPVEALLEEARRAGAGAWLLPAVSPDSWERSIAAAAADPDVRLAIGIHPQAVRDLTDEAIDEALAALPGLLRRHGAVAVGEIGVDHLHDRDPLQRERQRRVLDAQLDVARALGLPVLLHCVRAHGALLDTLRARGRVRGVMHAYSGSAELVRDWVALGLHVSFAGALTLPGARRAPEACRVVPDDRLLVETDAPYQTPWPHEGEANRPARLVDVARAVARLRGTPPEAVAERTWENAVALFG